MASSCAMGQALLWENGINQGKDQCQFCAACSMLTELADRDAISCGVSGMICHEPAPAQRHNVAIA
jgi:hypothetical protein